MNKLIELLVFLVVFAVLWWALNTILPLLGLPTVVTTIAVVVFVVIAVITAASYLMSGSWFWTRRV